VLIHKLPLNVDIINIRSLIGPYWLSFEGLFRRGNVKLPVLFFGPLDIYPAGIFCTLIIKDKILRNYLV